MYEQAVKEQRRSGLRDVVLVALVGVLLGMALCYALLLGAGAGTSMVQWHKDAITDGA